MQQDSSFAIRNHFNNQSSKWLPQGLTIAERRIISSNSKPESLSRHRYFLHQRHQSEEQYTSDKKYDYLFTVDSLNEMVVAGIPFRDAYKAVAEQLEHGTSLRNQTHS
jgi:argininosuccinate lyase